MNFYIETESGVTKNHPAFEDNLIQAFGAVPAQWEPFARVEMPIIGPYDVLESPLPAYKKINDIWTDDWAVRKITAEEKTAKQQAAITAFNNREQVENWSVWTLDEATCTMQPPIPRPAPIEGKTVFWCGADANWKEAPARLEGKYNFDFLAWQWVAVA